MRRFLFSFLAAALLFTAAPAQDLKLVGDTKVIDIDRTVVVKDKITLVNSLPVTVSAPAGGFGYTWDVPTGVTAKRTLNTLVITAAPKGVLSLSVEWSTVDFDKKVIDGKSSSITFAVGAPGPTPPGPDPKPPDPPTPPAPIPVEGFRVLFVVESSEIAPATASIINSKAVRDYLNSHCALSADGKSREWANFDKDADLSGYPKLWRDAMARPRKSLPWLIVSNGKTGVEVALPATIEDTLKLLKTIGGE